MRAFTFGKSARVLEFRKLGLVALEEGEVVGGCGERVGVGSGGERVDEMEVGAAEMAFECEV